MFINIILSSVIFFSLLTFVYLIYLKSFSIANLKINFLENSFFSLILIIISFYPFWLFGDFSAVGIFDEADSNIPIELSIYSGINQNNFIHNYFGGTIFKQILPSGNAFFSYTQFFFHLFDPIIGSAVIRVFGVWIMFLSIQLIFYKKVKIDKKNHIFYIFLSLVAGLVSVYGKPESYLYSFGAGLAIAFSILYVVVVTSDFNNIFKWILLVIISVIISSSITIIFFFVTIPFVFLSYALLMELDYTKILKKNLFYVLISFLLIFLNSFTDINNLLEIVEESKTFSLSDVKGSCTPYLFDFNVNNFQSLIEYLTEKRNIFFQGYDFFLYLNLQNGKGYPLTFIFILITFVISIWYRIRLKKNNFLIILLLSFFLPLLLQGLCFFSCLPLICRIRWEIIFDYTYPFYSLIVVFGIIDLLKSYKVELNKIFKFLSFVFIFIVIYLGIANMQLNVIRSLDHSGGWQMLMNKNSFVPTNYDNRYRSLSLDDVPKSSYLSYQGIYTADGTRFNYTSRYVIFWKNNVINKILKKHNVRQTLSGLNYLDLSSTILDSARVLNVKYIYSTKKIENKNFKQIKFIKNIKVKDLNDSFSNINFLSKISLIPNVYIYEINGSWDRLYYPKIIFYSKHNDFDLKYFDELKNLPRNSLVFDKNNKKEIIDYRKYNELTINFIELPNGLEIRNVKSSIVFNQEYSKTWRAFCDNNSADISPINGYMMLINLTKSCKQLKLIKND